MKMICQHLSLTWKFGRGVLLAALAIFLSAGCQSLESAEESTEPIFIGRLAAEPSGGQVGSRVTISGTDLPAGGQFDLVWHTVNGSWNIQGDYLEEYHGRIFDDTEYRIATVKTDANGAFSQALTIPKDFGFNHNVTIESDGRVLNRLGLRIEPSVEIEPSSGPLGTPITIRMAGIGWQKMENSWSVMYDNKFVGVLTSVTTGGSASAVIPATGKSGIHIIKILHGAYQYPYLNTEQNPRPDQPVFVLEFDITDGPPILPLDVIDQGIPVLAGAAPADTSGALVWSDPVAGPINTESTLHGQGFTAQKNVRFLWFRVVGNRIAGTGWDETSMELGSVTVLGDGSFTMPFSAPDDLGGGHRIEAYVDGDKVAETEFAITPSALPLEIASGPAGTQLKIHLKGVGWTETSNIYHLVYDNSYTGYACGFNSQGDVTILLPLAGDSGWHFIDLYPGIYKGKEMGGVSNFRIPQLTYREDHPGENLPAFRFAVFLNEE